MQIFVTETDSMVIKSYESDSQGDMKSDVVMVATGDFIFMFLCLDMVLYIEGHFTFDMSHYLD